MTIKNENQLESTKLPSEIREKVESAVELQGYRVTVGDVSSKAGITLGQAEDALKALASDTLGTIEVSSEGEVVYVLSRDFRRQLRSRSFMLRMEPRLKLVASTMAWIGRVAFGVTFITTVVAVWTAIIVIMSSSDRDDRDRGYNRGGGTMMFEILDVVRIGTLFNSNSSYGDDDRREGMNLLEAVFSFMFGDGDPNRELDDWKWNAVGNYIRSKGGVVAAEEIAPFLDLKPEALDNATSIVADEGYMIPVLTRFNGEPLVNSEGQLVYVFRDLQTTGVSQLRLRGSSPVAYLQEQRWQFSKANGGQLSMVIFFAAANIIGVSILNEIVYEQLRIRAIIAPGLPFLLAALSVYSWSFVALPLIRLFKNRFRNKSIDERNTLRLKSVSAVRSPPPQLQRKIESARKLSKRKFIDRRDVIYSSERDTEAQAKTLEEEDFDRRLNEIGQ